MLGVAAGISVEQPSRHRARGYPAGRPGIQAPGVGTDPEGGAARAGAGDPRDDAALPESDRLRHFACCHPKAPHATPLCSRPDIQSFQAQPVNTRRWTTRSPAGLGTGRIQSDGKVPPPPFHIREHLGVSCGGATRNAQRCTEAGGPSDINPDYSSSHSSPSPSPSPTPRGSPGEGAGRVPSPLAGGTG